MTTPVETMDRRTIRSQAAAPAAPVTIPARIMLVGHVLVTGPVQELHRYLLQQCPSVIYVRHPLQPFTPVGDRCSVYQRYRRGIVSQERIVPQWSLPPRLAFELMLFLRQSWLTCWWGLTRARGTELYIGVNPLNAMTGLLLKRLGCVRQVIYYTIDYVPRRFPNRWLNALYHWVDRACVRQCDQVWNLSGRMVDARETTGVPTRYRTKQMVVPMGTDLRVTPLGPDAVERTTAVYFGGLMEKQGVQLAIQALPLVRRAVPAARLLVIGGGKPDDRRRLEQLAQTLGVSEAVEFTGVIDDHDEALRRLTRCTVGLAPYTDDPDNFTKNTDPGKPKAYLSAGLPVVITDVPEVARIIEQAGAGFVVPYQPEALARILVQLMSDDALLTRCKQRAQALAQEYAWDRIFDRAFTLWRAQAASGASP